VDRDRDPFVNVSVWESETVSVIVDVADRVGVGGGVMVEVMVSDVVMELDSENAPLGENVFVGVGGGVIVAVLVGEVDALAEASSVTVFLERLHVGDIDIVGDLESVGEAVALAVGDSVSDGDADVVVLPERDRELVRDVLGDFVSPVGVPTIVGVL
jgi:hypothetical protein